MADHRPAYVERLRQVVSAEIHATSAEGLSEALNLDNFDACVVMSHHYLTDLEYLRCLAPSRVPYIGMLGPEKRRNRLFEDLGEVHRKLQGRAYGPGGLDIGADDADSSALSIAAQIQAVLKDAGGSGGVIAMDHAGNIATTFNAPGMFRAFIDTEGQIKVAIYSDEVE